MFVMRTVLDQELETDLVVFGGDQVSGYVLYDSKEVRLKWLESIKTVAELHILFVMDCSFAVHQHGSSRLFCVSPCVQEVCQDGNDC